MMIHDSWALMYIGDGSSSWESGGGKWYTRERWEYLWNSFDHETICEMDNEVKEAMDKYIFFYVLLTGVSWHFTPPNDGPDGFDPGDAWIEYDDVVILPIEEKVPNG